MEHLLLTCPNDWNNDDKGAFFEGFVADLLRPMRLQVTERLRFTGMEIDLLAKNVDQPRTILVECKSQRDPMPADIISKLLGNVSIRKADAGWLFSASDFTKDGRGQWEDIMSDELLSQKFMWFSPERTIDVLKQQRVIVDPAALLFHFADQSIVGNWTLIVSPMGWNWLVQIVDSGIPTRFSVFDARSGHPASEEVAIKVVSVEPRFSSLEFFNLSLPEAPILPLDRASVARVISGDTWDDLRPAKPSEFVGRDEIISDIINFFGDVIEGTSSTRTFAIQGPSGWGKSSLVLKIADLAYKGRLKSCSITAVDTRSATNSSFVSESLRLAFSDAVAKGLLQRNINPIVDSLRNPLDSIGLQEALDSLERSKSCIVLIFDQFEELFSKEELFETFNAVRELSLDLDARQLPLILGFAWKTDVSLPQQHPAYHLWHQLSDRRRTFKIRDFGRRDIQRIISKAEHSALKRLSPALRARVVEQCQNLPWLLKKLLVHVLQRISSEESQYLFLERELDVELLFKEDLSILGDDQIRCLKFVAQRAPVAVADVEENFNRDTTNLLINTHLLVRSGMNYVVYWDIFKDYLVDERVPYIPWARTFQRGPAIAVRALQALSLHGLSAIPDLGLAVGLKEGPAFNLFGDLVALQLVESPSARLFAPSRHLRDLKPSSIAEFVQSQLRRHIVVREISNSWEKEKKVDQESWAAFFSTALPRSSSFSSATIHQYANNFKNWLLFAGLLEQKERYLVRPTGHGRQMGLLTATLMRPAAFLGTAAPSRLEHLLRILLESPDGHDRSYLEEKALRNAISDALSVGIVQSEADNRIKLSLRASSVEELITAVKIKISGEKTVTAVLEAMGRNITERQALGKIIEGLLGAKWKDSSARRYAGGLLRYIAWLGLMP